MYETTDLYIAVSLRAIGFPLVELKQHSSPKKAIFVFEPTHPERDYPIGDAITDFWDRRLSVDARSFVDALNEVKARTYSIMG